ncbi:lysoplasmalogenase [Dyella flagellata]|uniref:Lysoplasmalogenase n=1 Tax=Dyella flagellata TaxID=1867833 RepID=A0ABQ5X5E0_9GAMM|nr:lysoplasmalogenase [Dyella flagellata]GLQ86819.1 hypothetical protein GCM10007898_03850 [Dyella flagellata]
MSAVSSTQVSPAPGRGVALVAATAAAAILGSLATHGGADAWHWLHWVCKPLATCLIFLSAWRVTRPVSEVFRRRMLFGLAFCLLGDIFLMLPQDLFVPGLASFLLAHVCFIAAFSSDVRFAARWQPWLGCLAFGAGMAVLLWPGIAPAMRVPVLAYIGVLATMAGQALGRASWLKAQGDARAACARSAGLGALLFMASDGLLAWDRFRAALPWATLYILGTYYAALWLLARSVERHRAQVGGR